MTVERARTRRLAEKVIRGVIEDIRTEDVVTHTGIAVHTTTILDQIEQARVEIKWKK